MFDMAIIGGGPAGLTAGIYARRAGLEVVLFEETFAGGQAATTSMVENYPGFKEIGGVELAMNFEAHARATGLRIQYDQVSELSLIGEQKVIFTKNGEYLAKSVVLCMGAAPRKLGVPGEEKLRGKGVSYCATCDGALYRGKKLAVVGGGDTAAADALFLSKMASEVTLIHRREELRAAKTLGVKTLERPNVTPLWNSEVSEIVGDERVSALRVKDVRTGRLSEIPFDGAFIAVGTEPRTQLLNGQVALGANGYIAADEDCRTSVKRVYAAGDIREKALRQIVTAAADGANAVFSAQHDLFA